MDNRDKILLLRARKRRGRTLTQILSSQRNTHIVGGVVSCDSMNLKTQSVEYFKVNASVIMADELRNDDHCSVVYKDLTKYHDASRNRNKLFLDAQKSSLRHFIRKDNLSRFYHEAFEKYHGGHMWPVRAILLSFNSPTLNHVRKKLVMLKTSELMSKGKV